MQKGSNSDIRGILDTLSNTISLNSAMNIGEMEQSRTGVTLPHHIAEAGSWRKKMMIFVC
jgi:hypothetical protein